MADHAKSTPTPPESPPEPFHDPESERPFREAFARRLPPEKRRELEEAARDAYHDTLERFSEHAHPDASDTWGMLRAGAVDLRETVAFLAAIAREHQESGLDERDTVLCILAGIRRLELEAVTERVEATAAFEPTRERPLPPELCAAVIAPSGEVKP